MQYPKWVLWHSEWCLIINAVNQKCLLLLKFAFLLTRTFVATKFCVFKRFYSMIMYIIHSKWLISGDFSLMFYKNSEINRQKTPLRSSKSKVTFSRKVLSKYEGHACFQSIKAIAHRVLKQWGPEENVTFCVTGRKMHRRASPRMDTWMGRCMDNQETCIHAAIR